MASCSLSKTLLDVEDCVAELKKVFSLEKFPITDDCTVLHRLEEKLETILQFGLKEKPGVFGVKRSYWDYICSCFSSSKRLHEGIKFVKSNSELKSSLGRGRALIRFCLIQKCLADTLQTCFIDLKTTRDFYSERCLPLQPKLWSSFITFLYDLNEINFDLNSQNSELDVSWPSFARKIFLSNANQALPSRNVSCSSLDDFSSQAKCDEPHVIDDLNEKDGYSTTEVETHHLMAANTELEADVLDLQKKCENLEKEICIAADTEQDFGMVPNDVEIFTSENAIDDDSKALNSLCLQPVADSVNVSKDYLKNMNMDPYHHPDSNVLCDSSMQNQSFPENNQEIEQNVSTMNNSHASSLPKVKLFNSERVSTVNQFHSVVSNSINSSKVFLPEKLDSLLQNESTPFHPEISKFLTELVLEMKILLDNIKIGSGSLNEDSSVSSHLSNLKVFRDYLEKILFMEFKKLDQCNMKIQSLEEYACCMKSIAFKHDNLIHSLLETVNLSVKGNENLYDRLCYLKEKLHSFCLLRLQTDTNAGIQNNSELVNNLVSDVQNVSDDYMNFNIENHSYLSKDCLESLQTFKNSSAKLFALNVQASTLQSLLDSSHKLNNNLISRVQDQEMHMRGITKELEEAHQLLSIMRKQHKKLQSAENIVKYDLQEKRKLLTKLKQQLEATREDCNLVRLKNSKSEAEWQNLRREFVQRNKQTSEESGFVDDKNIDDQNCALVNSVCENNLTHNIPDSVASLDNSSIESKYELKNNRLQLLEEQCQILCTNLKNSSKKRKELDCRLESWCKAIEKSHKNASTLCQPTEISNNNDESKDNLEEKISIDSNSDVDNSFSSSEIGSLNSDCCSYIPLHSTTVSSDVSFSVSCLETDQLVPSKTVDLEFNNNRSPYEEQKNSADSDILVKAICDTDSPKSSENVHDSSYCGSIESLEQIDEYQITNSVSSASKEISKLEIYERLNVTDNESLNADLKFDDLSKIVSKLEEEKKILQAKFEELKFENAMISEKLNQKMQELKMTETAKEREIAAIQFQLNSEVLKYERAIKEFSDNNEGLKDMKQKVSDQEQLILTLEEALADIQMGRESEKEHQWEQLQDIQLALSAREEECLSLSSSIELLEEFKKSSLKDRQVLENEILHLRNDTKELQKKIIKLLKEKDILWKTNDRLRYLHKIQIDDRWMDDHEVSECLGCRSHFSFLLRKHHCRQCGRIFCNSCSNNWLLTPSSRRQIRVCNECYMQHMEIKKDVRRDSNVQYFDESEDEAVVDDMSLNLNRSFSSEMHPNIADSIVSLPSMQVSNLKQKSHFISAPELHFNHENVEVPNKGFLNDSILSCQMEVVENDISGNLSIKANEEAILPILNEVNSTSIAWSFEQPCEAIPISLIYEDNTQSSIQQSVLHQSSCETEGVIRLSLPGIYKFHFDNKSRSTSMLVHYSFKSNILKEQEMFN